MSPRYASHRHEGVAVSRWPKKTRLAKTFVLSRAMNEPFWTQFFSRSLTALKHYACRLARRWHPRVARAAAAPSISTCLTPRRSRRLTARCRSRERSWVLAVSPLAVSWYSWTTADWQGLRCTPTAIRYHCRSWIRCAGTADGSKHLSLGPPFSEAARPRVPERRVQGHAGRPGGSGRASPGLPRPPSRGLSRWEDRQSIAGRLPLRRSRAGRGGLALGRTQQRSHVRCARCP